MVLEECLCQEVETANQWYNRNGMIVNQSKHEALVIGDTDYTFFFPVKNSIDIFGLNIMLTANFNFINIYLLSAERSIINLTSCCDSEN